MAASQPPLSRVMRRKEKTRRILMDVALRLFSEKGIYWTKIEDITERADVGKGTFYQYFETKEALLQALLQQGLDDLLAHERAALAGVKPGPRTLANLIGTKLDFFLNHPQYLLLFHQVRGLLQLTTESAKGLHDVYDEYLDRVGRLIRSGLNGKAGSAASGRELAIALSSFTSGLLTYYLLFEKGSDIRRRREEIRDQLERSLHALL